MFTLFSQISAFFFAYFAAVGVYIIFLPKLLITAGYSPFEIGVLFSAGPIMRFLVPFLFIKYISLTSRVFVIALFSSLISTLLFIVFHKVFFLALLFLALMGGFWSLVLPFVESVALENIQKNYGKARLYGSVGFIITALVLGHISLDFKIAMTIYIFTILLTLISGLSLANSIKSLPNEPSDERFRFLPHIGFWIAIFFMQVSFGGFYNFFTVVLEENRISLSVISYLWTFGVVAEIAMFLWQRRVLHLSLISLLYASFLLTAFRWIILYLFADNIFWLYFSQSLHAFSLALFHTVAISYIQENYHNKKLGQQFYLGIGYGLGGFSGSVIAGVLYGDTLFLWMAVFAFLGFLALFIRSYQPKP